ncbi:MAG: hypothetical protein CMN31_04070 [Sandaracinus sp.]|nr:hypothetical protein [Sandaracinus sp.]
MSSSAVELVGSFGHPPSQPRAESAPGPTGDHAGMTCPRRRAAGRVALRVGRRDPVAVTWPP